jgi:non-canonical (house-cleaning) NTP pyrophosphatase
VVVPLKVRRKILQGSELTSVLVRVTGIQGVKRGTGFLLNITQEVRNRINNILLIYINIS